MKYADNVAYHTSIYNILLCFTVNTKPFTQGEKDQIMLLYATHGKNWKKISENLPGRTRLQVRNYYYSTMRRTRGCTRTTYSIQNTLVSSTTCISPRSMSSHMTQYRREYYPSNQSHKILQPKTRSSTAKVM